MPRRLAGHDILHRIRHARLPSRFPRFYRRTRVHRPTISSTGSFRERVPRPPGNEYQHPHFEDYYSSDDSEPEQTESRPCTPTARIFLRDLPSPLVESLPEDGRSCGICQETYLHGEHPEQPVRLPCGHHFGRVCIERWLSPEEPHPRNNCPLCRRAFFAVEDSIPELAEDEMSNDVWDRIRLSRIAEAQDENIYGNWTYSRFPGTAEEAAYQMQVFEERWTDHMSLLTHRRRFVPRPDPYARTAFEILQSFQHNPSITYQEAIALGAEMGQLFIRLRSTMRLLKFLPAWNEYGPSPDHLMYVAPRHVIETALHRLLPVEEAWVWAQRGL